MEDQTMTLRRGRATHTLAVVCLLAMLAAASGCAMLQMKLREPGQKNKGFPEDVAYEYNCEKRPLPWFQVEQNEVLPDKLTPGEEFNHRMSYVMCPQDVTDVVSGTMYTRILFRGKPVLQEKQKHDLLPGRWVLDAFVTLPNDLKPGIYALQAEFKSKKGNFEAKSTFLVESD